MTEKDFAEAPALSEKRKSDRRKLIIDVRFDGGDATGIANTRDISVGGLYMTTNTAAFKTETPIFMMMSIGEREISLMGTIVRVDPGQGVGVRFQNLSPADEAFLRQKLDLE